MGLFAGLTRYAESWNLISQSEISVEDRAALANQVKCVKSTYGRSFCFFAKGNNYKQFIPLNDECSAEIGTFYDISEVMVQELNKKGETIYRCILKKDVKVA